MGALAAAVLVFVPGYELTGVADREQCTNYAGAEGDSWCIAMIEYRETAR